LRPLEPLDLMARLAALVPLPRMHLTRYHGVFAPHSKLRAAVTPAHRGKGQKPQEEEGAEPSSTPRHVAMSWARRLKRVFGIDIEACARCGGKLKIIARSQRSSQRYWRTSSARRQISISPSCRGGARAPPLQSRLL
jgi:Putative transposase